MSAYLFQKWARRFTEFASVLVQNSNILPHIDELGGPLAYNHYAPGWAAAGDAPFTWTKQIASNYGGTRNPLIVPDPSASRQAAKFEAKWHHIIDIASTILEAAGLPEPSSVDGIKQTPIEGVSMAYSFDDPKAPDRLLTQYFEIGGNRAIYDQGWLAGTIHRAPWERTSPVAAFPANGFGLLDMLGNVLEWTSTPHPSSHAGEPAHSCCMPPAGRRLAVSTLAGPKLTSRDAF